MRKNIKLFSVIILFIACGYILNSVISLSFPTDCFENSTHVYCINGTFLGNNLNTTKIILIKNSTINGTSSTNGRIYLNTTQKIIIENSSLLSYGSSGSVGADDTQTCNSNDLLALGGNGVAGSNGLFQTTGLTYIYNSDIYAYGGAGGKGGDALMNDGSSSNCDAQGGSGGVGGYGNITAFIVESINTTFFSYGGNGGNGGISTNNENNCASGCATGGGPGGSGGNVNFFNLLNLNDTLVWKNSTIISYSGNGGNGGATSGGSFCGQNPHGGSSGRSYSYLNSLQYEFNSYYLNISSGSGGASGNGGACGSGTAGSTLIGDSFINVSTRLLFKDYIINTKNTNSTFLKFYLFDTTTNKFGFFRSSFFYTNITLYCSAPLRLGNSSKINNLTIDSSCSSITYVGEDDFDNNVPRFLSNTTVPATPSLNDIVFINVTVNDTENDAILWVNFTVIDPVGAYRLNKVNGTRNNIYQIYEVWNSSSFIINMSGRYTISGIIRDNGTITTGTFSQFFEVNKNPNITLIKPAGTWGNNNSILLNFTVHDYDGVSSCWYRLLNATNNSQELQANTTVSCSHSINNQITFGTVTNRNYTLEFFANDTYNNLNSSLSNFSVLTDTIAPNITIIHPASNLSYRAGISLNFTAIENFDNSLQTCIYWITDSNGNPEVTNTTLSSCQNTTFSVSADGDYIANVFANDTSNNRNTTSKSFTVTQVGGGGGEQGGGGGGGGGGGSSESGGILCNIEITPSIISLSTAKRLQEVVINNKETQSFNPIFKVSPSGTNKDYSSELSVTNAPNTILSGKEASFGLKYSGTSTDAGENKVILSSENCKDIELTVLINQGAIRQAVSFFFDPNKTFIENMNDLLFSPVYGDNFVKNWMVFATFMGIMVTLSFKFIVRKNRMKHRGRIIALSVFMVALSIFFTVLVRLIAQSFGG